MGLSAAMFLGQHGVPSLLVERLPAVFHFPRAAFFHMRTLELFRSAGIETQVVEGSRKDFVPDGGIVLMDTVSGRKLADIIGDLNAGVDAVSPCRRLFLNQPNLEPILFERAREGGAELLRQHDVVGVTQDPDGVSMTIRHVDTVPNARCAGGISSGPTVRTRACGRCWASGAPAGPCSRTPSRSISRPICRAGSPRTHQRPVCEEPGNQRLLPDESRPDLGVPGHQHRGRSRWIRWPRPMPPPTSRSPR